MKKMFEVKNFLFKQMTVKFSPLYLYFYIAAWSTIASQPGCARKHKIAINSSNDNAYNPVNECVKIHTRVISKLPCIRLGVPKLKI